MLIKLLLFTSLFLLLSAGCVKTGNDSIPGTEGTNSESGDTGSGDSTSGLYIVSGNFQVAAPSLPFQLPLRVQCLKAPGVPAAGSQVGFTSASLGAGGSFSLASVTADSQGIAQTYFTPGSTPGTMTIQAYCEGMTVNFSLTVADQAGITLSYISGNAQTGSVGANLANPLVVKATKGAGSQPAENIFVRLQVITGNGNISSQNSYTGVTNSSGEISVPFTLGTIAGGNSVVAVNVADPTQQIVFTATGIVPLNSVSLSRSTIFTVSGSPTEVIDNILQANGLDFVKIKVQLKDTYGNNYPFCGDSITTFTSDGSLSGTFSCVDGLYSGRQLTAPTTNIGPNITLSGTFNGNPLTTTHQASLVSGAFDKDTSQVSTAASSILANGTSTTIVTVTLKDSFGNQLSSGGQAVLVTTNGGTLIGSPSVVDNNNGTYTIVLRSSTSAQTITLSATAGGVSITDTALVQFTPGACEPTTSGLIASQSILSPGPGSLANITLVCKDIHGNNLTASPGATIPVFSSDLGGFISGVTDLNNGSFQVTYEAPAVAGVATIRASYGGVYLSGSVTIFVTTSVSPPSPVFSTLSLNEGAGPFAANEACSYSLTLQTKDNAGNNITSGGHSVVFNVPAQMSKTGSVVDHNNGRYSQTICAPANSLKDARMTVTLGGTNFYSDVTRSFYGAPSLSLSEIVAFPSAIEANGTSTTLLYADFKDANGIDIPNGGLGTVVFSATNGTLIGSVSDNSNGSYSQYLRSMSSAGQSVVTATLNGNVLSDSVNVEFFSATNLAGYLIDCTNISSYNNRPVVVDNGTLTMNTFGPNGSCESSFVFTSIILRNAATLTHTATGTASSEYGLSLRASSINIDGTSKIDVSQKGISSSTANFKVPSSSGPTSINGRLGTSGNCIGGASYGGDGGGPNSARSYGSLFRPFESGMSSSCVSVFGGGRVKLVVDGSLTINGSILARGQTGTAGAAGGSIWIQANTLDGNGNISANGGAGSASGGGGGGGRIAIYGTNFSQNFALPGPFGTNVVSSGGIATFGSGAAGTIIVKTSSDSFASLIIDNKTTVTTAVTEIKAPAAAVPNALSTTNLTQSGNFADTYSNSNPYLDWYIDPSTTQNASASKNDNILFQVTGVPDINTVVSPGNMSVITNAGVAPAELVLVLDNLDLKGSSLITSSAQILIKKGDLSSGSTSSAVLVGLPSSRIEFVDSSLDINLGGQTWTASQSSFNRDLIVRNGTLNFTGEVNLGEYSFSSYSVTASMTKLTAKNLYLSASGLTVTQCSKGSYNVNLSGTMELASTSTLSHASTSTVALDPECTLEIRAQSVLVGAASAIHADAKGFFAATNGTCRVADNKNITTTFFGSTITSSNNGMYVTAGHGGRGGMHASFLGSGNSIFWGNEVYGSFVDPKDSGASCNGHSSYGVNRGGGVVRITTTTGDLINNGRISANGEVNATARHGAAGGSVYINTNVLSGSGTFQAIGASPGFSGGGGGGGRIALYYSSLTGGMDIGAQTDASGGGVVTYLLSAAGTVFHKNKSSATGSLIIDNKGKVALGPLYFNTPILVPTLGQETLAAASATNVVVSSAADQLAYSTPYLKGLYLNPHEDQNNTASLLDDTHYEITDQVRSVLTLDGDARTISAAFNSKASFVLKLTELVVKSKAHAFLPPVIAQTMAINDATVTVRSRRLRTALNVTGDLTLSNSSFLQQEFSTTFAEPEYSLDVQANNIVIDATSTVTAEGRGYLTTTTSSCMVAGKSVITTNIRNESSVHHLHNSSHGGYGSSNPGGKTNQVYGSIAYPYWSGASCDYNGTRRAGGGIVKLKALSNLTVNGTVKANGEPSGANEGNAAGGSIIIDAPTLQGSGSIDASGGIAPNTWGGGGGRIAVYYSSSTFPLDNINAFGGGAGLGAAGAGTVYYRDTDELYGSLKIKNRGFYPNNGTNLPTIVHTPLVLPSGLSASAGSLSTSSNLVTLSSSELDFGQNTEKLRGLFLVPNPGLNATLTATDDQMVEIVQQSQGNQLVLKTNPTSISGSNGNVEFALVLKNLEIGAGATFAPHGTVLVKEGDESSNDSTTFRIIQGSITYPMNSAGAVMRNLKLEFQGLQNFTAQTDSRLTLGYPLTMGSNLSFDSSTLLLDTPRGTNISVGGNLSLTNSSHLYHSDILETGLDRALEVEVGGNATIDNTSTFNTEGRGLYMFTGVAGQTNGCRVSPTKIVGTLGVHYYAAPHGGTGNSYTISGYPTVYGSWAEPITAGSSCGGIGYTGQVGGGVIRLFVNGTLNLNGTLNSNSQTSLTPSWGGAGGSIWVKASTLNGNGIMRANGGRGGYSPGYGGGGGRIAVYYDTLGTFGLSNIEAFGGASGVLSGAAGTIFVKQNSESLGTMIINNNGNFASGTLPKTFLTLPDTTSMTISGTSVSLGANQIENTVMTGHLKGLFINPNPAANSTSTLSDDAFIRISDHSSPSQLTLASIPGSVNTTSGNPFVCVFKNLDVKNGGVFAPSFPCLVTEGDLASNDTTTLSVSGGQVLGAGIEFMGLSSISLTNNSNLTLPRPLTIPGTLSLNSSSLTVTSSSTTIPGIQTGGDVILRSGSTLSHLDLQAAAGSPLYRLYIEARDVDIDGTSSINVSGKGYKSSLNYSGYNGACAVGPNHSYVNQLAAPSTCVNYSGGSHGGVGVNNWGYGSMTDPVHHGSSGAYSGRFVGSGGGVVRIKASRDVIINGRIEANGQDTSTDAGGAGGSIWIESDTLSGSGSIKANGGPGNSGNYCGAGGRISLKFSGSSGSFAYPVNIVGAVSATLATASCSATAGTSAGAGTIYLYKNGSSTFGDLIAKNIAATAAQTVLPVSTSLTSVSGGSSVVTGSTLSTVANSFSHHASQVGALADGDHFQGLCINPNTANNVTARLSDDVLFQVMSNTPGTVTTGTGVTSGVSTGESISAFASSGQNFRAVACFDNLQISGGARLHLDRVYVTSGDLVSNNSTSLLIDGVLNTNILDAAGANISTSGAGASYTGATAVCSGNINTGGCP